MKRVIFGFALLVASHSALAALNGFVWVNDVNGTTACYPSNSAGQVSLGAVAMPLTACQFSFAWNRDPMSGAIQCQAVGVGGQFFVGSVAVPGQACVKSYLRGMDATGMVRCFGQGADGNIVPNIPPVPDNYCNNW